MAPCKRCCDQVGPRRFRGGGRRFSSMRPAVSQRQDRAGALMSPTGDSIVSPMIAVAAPAVAKLLDRPRRWAGRRVASGAWGPIIGRRGKAKLVDLRAVEA